MNDVGISRYESCKTDEDHVLRCVCGHMSLHIVLVITIIRTWTIVVIIIIIMTIIIIMIIVMIIIMIIIVVIIIIKCDKLEEEKKEIRNLN